MAIVYAETENPKSLRFFAVGPFTAAPPTGTNNIYVVYQGKAVGTTTPGENSIEFGMIKSINGGYENKATVSSTITVDSADNMMLCGPVSFTGTVTVNGTLTVV